MTRSMRFSIVTLPCLAGVFWLGAIGCSSSNEPSNTTMTTAGGSGGATGGSGGATGGSGGATGGSGGATTTTGTGGAGGTTGGAGGTTGGTGGAPDNFTPLCSQVPVTAAGEAPTKGGACTGTDSQLCYKTCGPNSVGFKSETCTGGIYAEQSGCDFPANGDYACYKIPTTISSMCPTTVPKASDPCTVPACTPCNLNGSYADSSGAAKQGYCVCPASASGMGKWTCASGTAWPCPNGKGC